MASSLLGDTHTGSSLLIMASRPHGFSLLLAGAGHQTSPSKTKTAITTTTAPTMYISVFMDLLLKLGEAGIEPAPRHSATSRCRALPLSYSRSLVRAAGFEPATSRFQSEDSILAELHPENWWGGRRNPPLRPPRPPRSRSGDYTPDVPPPRCESAPTPEVCSDPATSLPRFCE